MEELQLGDKFLAEVSEHPYGKMEIGAEVVGLDPVEIYTISGGVKHLRYKDFRILLMADESMSHVDKSFPWCPGCMYRRQTEQIPSTDGSRVETDERI